MNEGEKKVVKKMIQIYCKAHHQQTEGLCNVCMDLDAYAIKRLENCPFGENKPTCEKCDIHCYKSDMRQQIRVVMRFAGPRMLFLHPIDTFHHFIREYKRRKKYKSKQ